MNTDIHFAAGAYALDALTDLERAAFTRHLASCPPCALEAAELRETATRLADITQATPPNHLKANLMDAITRTRQAGPAPDRSAVPATARGWRRWSTAVAAGIVLATGAGVTGYALHATTRPVTVRDPAADQVLALLRAPDARLTTQSVTGGTVTVITSASQDRGIATVTGLASPGQQAYQLWLIKGAQPISVGLLRAGATSAVQAFDGARGADAFGVSREPTTGSPTPTQPLVTSFPLA